MPTNTCSRAVLASTNVDLPAPDHRLVIAIRDNQLDTMPSPERYIPTTTRYMRYPPQTLPREHPAPAIDELPRLVLVIATTR